MRQRGRQHGWRATTYQQLSQQLTLVCVSLVADTVKYEPLCEARLIEIT